MNSLQIIVHRVPYRALPYSIQKLSTSSQCQSKESCKVLVVGGGSGGCAVAAKLCSKLGPGNVTILEPNERHYYQPMFTLIGGGMKNLDNSFKPMKDVLPAKAKWIKEKAEKFDPKNNSVTTSTGREINYDILLVAIGLQLNYEKIPGLVDALSIPNGNVSSIYSPKYVDRTYQTLKNFTKGNAIFTFPSPPIKCAGAPQKIAYISEQYLSKTNKRKDANVIYNTALPVIFGVKHYADALWKIVEKRNIQVNVNTNLIEVKPSKNIAVFQKLDGDKRTEEVEYSMLHAVPPMSAPTELTLCKELVDAAGFVDVDKHTLQHLRYKNVFAIGDCSSTPNAKTLASAAAQSPIVYNHIMATLEGKKLTGNYYGYASCPLVTGYSTCMLAEFDYNLNPVETFPFAQNKERISMFIMKRYFMPPLYWQLMVKGFWDGPERMRKFFSIFKLK